MVCRELDRRQANGLEVVLLWNGNDSVSVSVNDSGSGDAFELEVDAADALDAFRHPFAYAAGHGDSHARPAADPTFADGQPE
jgi:hypothetical protein